MRLNEIDINTKVRISKLNLDGLMRERLLSLGFTINSIISKVSDGRKKEISIYLIKDMMVALRIEESSKIEVCL